MNMVFQSARELARRIRAGTLSSAELCEEHLKRISAMQPSINALHVVNDIPAREQARKCDEARQRGVPGGRLHGVFFSAKDSIDVEGLPTGHGSVHGGIPKALRSSTSAKRLQDAGAICIGKGNMAEYGKSYYTENPLSGRTNNPFDVQRSPGGSSGGDAAAIASGMASFALASDSGGSVRVPANFCGLFGLYPTRGVFSDGGASSPPAAVAALMRNTGILTRSLDDVELLLSVLSGFDNSDPYSVPWPTALAAQRPTAGRFLFFSSINGVACDPEIEAALRNTVNSLEAAGLRGEERCPAEFAASYEIFIILAGQTSLHLEDLLAKEGGSPRDFTREGGTMKNLRHRIATELPQLVPDTIVRSWARVDALRFSIASLWEHVDFIVAPVAATLAPLHGTSAYSVGSQTLQSQQVFQFASSVNTLGLPAIAFPVGISKQNLPVGLQIIGPRFSERTLISVLRRIGITKALVPRSP